MVYHGPSLSNEEERRLKILRAICQALFWACIVTALVIPYSLNVPIIVGLAAVGLLAFYGELRIGGRLRHHKNSQR